MQHSSQTLASSLNV